MSWPEIVFAVVALISISKIGTNLGHIATGLHRIANAYDIWAASTVLPPSEAEEEAVQDALKEFTGRKLDETGGPYERS